jgi:hypothetical protein
MMRAGWWISAALIVTSLCSACGGGGGGAENFGDSNDNTSTPGGPQGSPAVIEFVVPGADTSGSTSTGGATFESAIGPIGSDAPQASLIRFTVLNAQGGPARNGIRVNFTLEGPADATLTKTQARTQDGFVDTVLRAGATEGNATLVAHVEGTDLVARSGVVVIGRRAGPPVAIEFFGLRTPTLFATDSTTATPETRTQLGVRGSGVNQAVDVVFLVFDDRAAAAPDGTIVDFTLFGPNGGETISPSSAPTSKGFVSATILTGTRPGPVEVEARVRGTGVSARAIPITIGSALNPSGVHMSIAAECLNVAGRVTFGLEDQIRAGLADEFGNQVPIGSAASFFTEGGGIQAQGITEDGFAATAKLVTQEPIAENRRETVLAVTTGQESFTDLNGNGQFDPGEPFADIPSEPFLDANEDGVFELGEFFLDTNNNGIFDSAPNGVRDDQILISASMPIVFSGHTQISISPTTFDIPKGGSQAFTVIIADEIGTQLTGITKVTVTATNGTVFPTSFAIPDSNFDTMGLPVPELTAFTIVLFNNAPPTPVPAPSTSPGPVAPPSFSALTITVDSPIATGGDVKCPGGNGSKFLTIFGTVE